jgi:hypothetical protein
MLIRCRGNFTMLCNDMTLLNTGVAIRQCHQLIEHKLEAYMVTLHSVAEATGRGT